jgi:hypothetical protein
LIPTGVTRQEGDDQMRLLNVKHHPWGEPLLLVDQIPPLETLRFRKLRVNDPVEPDPLDVDGPTQPGHLYVAEQDGYVAAFFQVDPDQRWLGPPGDGREVRLHLDDGTAETLVEPWSSITGVVNRYLPKLAAREVLLTDDRRSFQDAAVTDNARGFEDVVSRTTRAAITMQLWYEIPGLVRSMDKQAQQQSLRQANPGGLGVEQIAQLSAAAIQRLARDPANRMPEESLIDEVVGAVTAAVAAVPPRPDPDGPMVAPADVATDVVHEYLRVRRSWGWPVGRASAWAVGELVDRLRTFERVADAAASAVWAFSEREAEADYDVILDLQRSLEDRADAAREMWEAQDPEPWLPVDAAALLAAAPPSQAIPDELFERARTTSTGELLGWVEDVRHPPERPLRLEYGVALATAHNTSRHRDEERPVLQGLERQLAAAEPRWWPGNWRRRAELRTRIARAARVVSDLDRRVKESEDRVLESLPRTRTAEDAQQAWQRRVLERAAAAAQELRRREQGRFDDRVVDPPEHLLQALGPPRADLAGWQAWRAEALQLERARAAALTIEGVATPAEERVQHNEIRYGDPAVIAEASPISPTSAPGQWPGLGRDGFRTADGPEPTMDLPE